MKIIQPLYFIRRSCPKVGYKAIEFSTSPLVGTIDGINEKGLGITYNYATAIDVSKPAPPISSLIGIALRQCATVEDAVLFFKKSPRVGSGLLMVADPSGAMVSIELSHTRTAARYCDKNDFICHTNDFKVPETLQQQISPDAVFNSKAPQFLRGKKALDSSYKRGRCFDQLLADPRTLDLDDLNRIMSDHGPDSQPGENTICVHSPYWQTTASLQFLLAERTMRVSYSTACEAEFQDFTI